MCKKKIVQGQTIFSEKVNVFPIICFFYLDNIENVSTILHTHIFEQSVGLPCGSRGGDSSMKNDEGVLLGPYSQKSF